MNYDKVKAVLFPVLEGMGYTLDLDDGFDLQPAVVTFDRQNKTMCIDPKADSLNQVIGVLSMYFERFPSPCKKVTYYHDGQCPDEAERRLESSNFELGYVRFNDYDLKEFFRFICALMLAANVKKGGVA